MKVKPRVTSDARMGKSEEKLGEKKARDAIFRIKKPKLTQPFFALPVSSLSRSHRD